MTDATADTRTDRQLQEEQLNQRASLIDTDTTLSTWDALVIKYSIRRPCL